MRQALAVAAPAITRSGVASTAYGQAKRIAGPPPGTAPKRAAARADTREGGPA